MKVYTLVITQCQESEVTLLNVIMKTDPAEIAKIIEDDYNDNVSTDHGDDDEAESDFITVTPEEIVNDAGWSYDCGSMEDLFINYHVLVQNLEVTNDTVELTNPEA